MANGADGIITEDSAASNCFFFDELGDVPSYTQAKLLRFVQFGEIQKVGSNKTITIGVEKLQIVAASNKPECIREDLKARFKCFRVPRLIERFGDVPILIKHFINDPDVTEITKYTLKGLVNIIEGDFDIGCTHLWNGNIRELKRVLEDAVYLCKKRKSKTLYSEDFPAISWEHEANIDSREEPRQTAQLIQYLNKQYNPTKPYKDDTEKIKIDGLANSSEPLPYHYFLKSSPAKVKNEEQIKRELELLRLELKSIGKTMVSTNENHPTPEPTPENPIIYDNTTPPQFGDEFYEHHAKIKTLHIKIVNGYKKQGYSITRNTVSKNMKKAEERLLPT